MMYWNDAKKWVEELLGLSHKDHLGSGGDSQVWKVDDAYVIKLTRMSPTILRRHRLMMREKGHPIAEIMDLKVIGFQRSEDSEKPKAVKHWDGSGPVILTIVVQKYYKQERYDAQVPMPPSYWEVNGITWCQDDGGWGNAAASRWIDLARIIEHPVLTKRAQRHVTMPA